MITFKEWIKSYENIDSPVGDLASDISQDDKFPESNNYNTCLNYLEYKTNWHLVIEAFNTAWKLYETEVLNNQEDQQ